MRVDIERFGQVGAQVVAVAPDTTQAVARFVRDNAYPFPLLADQDHSVFDAYDVVSRLASLGQRPAVFIVNPEQRVAYDTIGTQQWQIPSNTEVLAALRSM